MLGDDFGWCMGVVLGDGFGSDGFGWLDSVDLSGLGRF